MNHTAPKTGVVIIGRNEGRRLKACLRSVHHKSQESVYVDSNSSDGSALIAQNLGFRVLELDPNLGPLNAARARNAGFQALQKLIPALEYVQFIDGDCVLDPQWLSVAENWLSSHPETVAVCGRRRERSSKRSLYIRLCDIEWNTPVGQIKSFGGDALIRAKPFAESGGYNEGFPSGEEPDLSLRLRKAGGVIERLAAEMTIHDAAIRSLNAWAHRMIRGGYGARLVCTHWRGKVPSSEVPFAFLTRSTRLWTEGWLAGAITLILVGSATMGLAGATLALAASVCIWLLQAVRTARHIHGRVPSWDAFLYGVFTMLGKWPLRMGHALHWWDTQTSRTYRSIDYKP